MTILILDSEFRLLASYSSIALLPALNQESVYFVLCVNFLKEGYEQ
jgi:hypothetical protein